MKHRDKALSIIVMAIEPKLLYIIGEPEDPKVVYDKLCSVFQKKTWANKMRLRKKLYSLKLDHETSIHQHLKNFVEVFSDLAVIGDAVEDEDRVIHLLASLPDSFETFVTAMEAQEQVPSWEAVTEKLLHVQEKSASRSKNEEALVSRPATKNVSAKKNKKLLKCYHCKKLGHFKNECPDLKEKKEEGSFSRANCACDSSSRKDDEYDSCGLTASVRLLSAIGKTNGFILDSGASKHMCHQRQMFTSFIQLRNPFDVTLGDGSINKATAIGKVDLKIKSEGENSILHLQNVLFVETLSFNLISVSRLSKAGCRIVFDDKKCEILDSSNEIVALGTEINDFNFQSCVICITSFNSFL